MSRTKRALSAAMVAVSFAAAAAAAAVPAAGLETDQYTVPPAPLADVGPQVQQAFRVFLREAVGRTNIAVLERRRLAAGALMPWDRRGHATEAARLMTDDAVVGAFVRATGPGFVESDVEVWLRTATFPGGPHAFDPPIGQSVYGANPFGRPVTLQSLSPTVNLFGVHLGTDKVGHFVGQGYEYYEAFRAAERAGQDPAACVGRAVAVGVSEERTYFGLLTVGVYSNADLAANYAGLKFLLNLTRPVLVDGRRLEPMLARRDGLWAVSPDLPADFLRPFVTDHWDESLNPNFYSDQLRATVRANFAPRAAAWAAAYRPTGRADPRRLRALATFYGEPYGHSGPDGVVSTPDMCPPDTAVPPGRPVVAQRPAVPGPQPQ